MSIKVAVRLRPFNQREKDRGEKESVIEMVIIKFKFYFQKN